MSLASNITVGKQDNLVVTGVLNFNTVPQLRKLGCQLLQQVTKPVFDLKQVTLEDNSGLALLVEWAKCAKEKHGKSVSFINVPDQLRDIAKLSGLENILPIG